MIAIAGAGLIGSSIAWRLAQRGRDVTLFDAGVFGGEASSAGAGMLSPGGEFDRPSHWIDLGVESLALYPAFVEELRGESGASIDYRVCGCLQYEDPDRARARAAFQSTAGIRVEQTADGLSYPEEAIVDPTDLLRALRCACEKRGVKVLERQPVREMESTDYDAVVIAAGAWSGSIRVTHNREAVALPESSPVRGHLLGFQPQPGSLSRILRHEHTYVLQRSNGFTIAGSNEENAGFDREMDQAQCDDIHRRAARLFPALAEMQPVSRWLGFRPFSPDGPHIRRIDGTNVWLAHGHFRNGILLAPITAQRIAASILESL